MFFIPVGGLERHTFNIKIKEVSEEDKHSNRMHLIIPPWDLPIWQKPFSNISISSKSFKHFKHISDPGLD